MWLCPSDSELTWILLTHIHFDSSFDGSVDTRNPFSHLKQRTADMNVASSVGSIHRRHLHVKWPTDSMCNWRFRVPKNRLRVLYGIVIISPFRTGTAVYTWIWGVILTGEEMDALCPFFDFLFLWSSLSDTSIVQEQLGAQEWANKLADLNMQRAILNKKYSK